MTRQEVYDKIVEKLHRPEFAAKVNEIEALCEKDKVLGIEFHLQRAKNMLDAIPSASEIDMLTYKISFDTSIRDIQNLIEKYTHIK